MLRGTAALAYSYFLHWLKKEDIYSQQSPFVFTLYQGLVKHLASKRYLEEDTDHIASSYFSTPYYPQKQATPSSAEEQSSPYWKPTQKGIALIAYFCSQTSAQQVIEIGTGNGAVTRGLERLSLSNLHSLEEDLALWQQAKAKGSTTTNYNYGTAEDALPRLLDGLDQLDFLLINSLFSKAALQKVLALCKPKLHSESILAIAHIHRSSEMEQAWAEIQADPRVQLTVDFFDYGLVWFAYPGPKSHLILAI
jgi:predicted O-methyltransferase YrrM